MNPSLLQSSLSALIRLIVIHLAFGVLESGVWTGIDISEMPLDYACRLMSVPVGYAVTLGAFFCTSSRIAAWLTTGGEQTLPDFDNRAGFCRWLKFLLVAVGILVAVQALSRLPVDFLDLQRDRRIHQETGSLTWRELSRTLSMILESLLFICYPGRVARLLTHGWSFPSHEPATGQTS